jgi:hypothetical protein
MAKMGRMSKEDIEKIVSKKNIMTVLTCGQFTSKQELMRQFGIGDANTFERHFGEYYKQSAEFWKSESAQAFHRSLAKGEPTIVKHAAKTILGLTEKTRNRRHSITRIKY